MGMLGNKSQGTSSSYSLVGVGSQSLLFPVMSLGRALYIILHDVTGGLPHDVMGVKSFFVLSVRGRVWYFVL